mgnify:CR=1 FL=1
MQGRRQTTDESDPQRPEQPLDQQGRRHGLAEPDHGDGNEEEGDRLQRGIGARIASERA